MKANNKVDSLKGLEKIYKQMKCNLKLIISEIRTTVFKIVNNK